MRSLPLLFGTEGAWRLRDLFGTPRAAGTLADTPAEPGPGARTVTDTEGKLSTAGGQLVCAGGKASPVYGDPGMWWPQSAREAGRLLLARMAKANTTSFVQFGWDSDAAGQIGRHGFHYDVVGQVAYRNNAVGAVAVGSYLAGVTYGMALAMRAAGGFALLCEADGPWRLMYVDDATVGACVPGLAGFSAPLTLADLRVPERAWLPPAVVSDGFDGTRTGLGATDGQGHPEGASGGPGSGGGGAAWSAQAGTWGVASGAAACSALSGGMGQAAAQAGTPHVVVRATLGHVGGQVGLALRAADADHCIKVCHDGASVSVVERWAGVDGAALLLVARAFGAGALMATLDGAALRVYWNGTLAGAVTVSAAFASGAHGLHTTHADNTFGDVVMWARGLEGQYALLGGM